jgi:hypothetical protein
MWKNNMEAIARVGALTRPEFRNMPTLDLGGAVDNYTNARDKSLEAARRQAYVDELTAQHPEAAAQIAANPEAYMKMLNDNKAAERDQQFKMDMLDKQFNNSIALQDRQYANAVGLAKLAAQLKAQENAGNNGGMGGINMNNPFDKAMVQNFAKDYEENVKNAQSTYDKYANADRLLDKIETGGMNAVPLISGAKALTNPDVAQFIAAQNELIPTMRPTGSGSTSDKDMAIFAKATFGIDKPKEANRNIIRGRMAAAENERDYNQLKAQWISAGGHPVAFEQEWNNYLDMNPIFSNDDGSLNKTRVSGRKWFNAPQTQTNNNTSDNVVDASEYFK